LSQICCLLEHGAAKSGSVGINVEALAASTGHSLAIAQRMPYLLSMPSFDISSEANMQAIDDAVNQTKKEIDNRFDFKNVKVELVLDTKEKTVKISSTEAYKLEAIKDAFNKRLIKRGVSVLALNYGDEEKASGSGARIVAKIAAGIEKEKAKEIVAIIKNSGKKVQAQIHDDKVKVTGKNRDDLQETIALVRTHEPKLGLPLQFGNFRE
jgi:uncharacterized protein YajQ (UPF0234 family)